MRADCGTARQPSIHGYPKTGAQSFANRLCLQHHESANITGISFSSDFVQRRVGQCADRVKTQVPPELDPNVITNVARAPSL